MIGIVGLGFVGLTTAIGLAHHTGNPVYGYDSNPVLREKLKTDTIPFHEPELSTYLAKYRNKSFFICETMEEMLSEADIIFFCVGTPSLATGGVDLQILIAALQNALQFVTYGKRKTFVVKSTVPPSTNDAILRPLIEESGFVLGQDIVLLNNPEFLREGYAWNDFIHPDRIVIGENELSSGEEVEKLYLTFDAPIHRVSWSTAEFIKASSNALLATMISFANEMSMIADQVKFIDVKKSFQILHSDRRWHGQPAPMASYVYPGCGFGGYCLPKDIRSIYHFSKNIGYEPTLLKRVIDINENIKTNFVNKIAAGTEKDEVLGILGLSFKPESDDVRDSPAKAIIEHLLKQGYRNLIAYDPLASHNFHRCFNLPISYADTLEEVIEKSSSLVITTACKEFIKKKDQLAVKKVWDGRYCL
jgi:UDPglucose 6-dehydrogenase